MRTMILISQRMQGAPNLGTLFKVMVLAMLLSKPEALQTLCVAFSHEIIWTDFLVIKVSTPIHENLNHFLSVISQQQTV